jgi:hypothetical protein
MRGKKITAQQPGTPWQPYSNANATRGGREIAQAQGIAQLVAEQQETNRLLRHLIQQLAR